MTFESLCFQSIWIVLVKAGLSANWIRADSQLIPDAAPPPPFPSPSPHSLWNWLCVRRLMDANVSECHTWPNTSCAYSSFNDYFLSHCSGRWGTRVSGHRLILALSACDLHYLSDDRTQHPCNSQDVKPRMLIKCGPGDNTSKGHNYNFIKLWSGR